MSMRSAFGPSWSDIDKLQRQIDELRHAIFPLERINPASPQIPKFTGDGSCFICGDKHQGLPCPKIIPTSNNEKAP